MPAKLGDPNVLRDEELSVSLLTVSSTKLAFYHSGIMRCFLFPRVFIPFHRKRRNLCYLCYLFYYLFYDFITYYLHNSIDMISYRDHFNNPYNFKSFSVYDYMYKIFFIWRLDILMYFDVRKPNPMLQFFSNQ